MCLCIKKSSMLNPIPVLKAFKMLKVADITTYYPPNSSKIGIYTPFQNNLVPFGDGYYVAKDYRKACAEAPSNASIFDGYLHSGNVHDSWAKHKCAKLLRIEKYPTNEVVSFPATALDVCAHGTNSDMISRGLYIPAMDVRNYTDARLQVLKKQYPMSFTAHTNRVLAKLDRPAC